MAAEMCSTWKSAPIHQAVKPLDWLLGTWKSISAEGSFPTISPFDYCEEITFTSLGQPILNYSTVSWHPVKKCPMHLETGFLRINPGTSNVAFMVAHNFGLTSLEEGIVMDKTLEMKSTHISRMSFAKDPQVTGIERVFKIVDEKLVVTVSMETSKTELSRHLEAVYVRE